MERPLVGLVDDDHAGNTRELNSRSRRVGAGRGRVEEETSTASPVAGKVRLGEELSEQHPVRHVLEQRSFGGAVLETNAVANLREATGLTAQTSTLLVSDPGSQRGL